MPSKSLVGQVNYALQTLNKIGKRKTGRDRSRKNTKGIYAGQTIKNYISRGCTFAKWCKEKYGIRYLVEITPDMGRAYVLDMQLRGLSPFTICATASALRMLEKGIKKAFHKSVHIIPKDIRVPKRRLIFRRDRFAYTDEQLEKIFIACRSIDPEAAVALEIQYHFGLRVSELINLRKQDIDFKRNMLIVWRGKGGRLREVPIESERARQLLEALCYGLDEMDKLFPRFKDRFDIERMMEKACHAAGIEVHKTHNLRHSYAVKKYVELRKGGMTDTEARLDISQRLGHNRLSVVNNYVPSHVRKQML